MKVTRNTPDTLGPDHVPWLPAPFILVFFPIIAGVGPEFAARDEWVQAVLFGGFGGGACLFALVVFTQRAQHWRAATRRH